MGRRGMVSFDSTTLVAPSDSPFVPSASFQAMELSPIDLAYANLSPRMRAMRQAALANFKVLHLLTPALAAYIGNEFSTDSLCGMRDPIDLRLIDHDLHACRAERVCQYMTTVLDIARTPLSSYRLMECMFTICWVVSDSSSYVPRICVHPYIGPDPLPAARGGNPSTDGFLCWGERGEQLRMIVCVCVCDQHDMYSQYVSRLRRTHPNVV